LPRTSSGVPGGNLPLAIPKRKARTTAGMAKF